MKYFKKFASAADAETFLEEADEQLYIYITNTAAEIMANAERIGHQVYYEGVGIIEIPDR